MSASTVERSLARSPLAPARTIETRRSAFAMVLASYHSLPASPLPEVVDAASG
jgi:hypothetical protein